jgi:hypothetical protein
MLGTGDAAFPPPSVVQGAARPETVPLVKTPADSVARMVDFIVATVGTTGSSRAKLAFLLGPLAFDHSDDEIAAMVAEGFALARDKDIAVGFHLDDAMFWSRSPLYSDENKEWVGSFDARVSAGTFIDWGMPAAFPARMCFNCPAVRAEVSRRAQRLGAAIAAELDGLRASGREHLFAGVIVGWEAHMGHDFELAQQTGADARLGFHALANAGYGPGNPPRFGEAVAGIVKEHLEGWAAGLLQAGLPRDKLYSHVNFMPRRIFEMAQQAGQVPPSVSYRDVVNSQPSSVEPEVAFGDGFNPGFTLYATPGTLEQVHEVLRARGNPRWAQAEGTNAIPGLDGGATTGGGDAMATYLAQRFDYGAALVTLFSIGIGGPAMADHPFRRATEGAEAVAAYRDFLGQ